MKYLIHKTKSKIGLLVLLIAFSLQFTSCEFADDLLDTKSSSDLTSSDIFKTPERIEGLVNGTYKSLKNGSLYGSRLLFNMDIRGEEFINLTNNAFSGFDGWANNYSASSSDVAGIWGAAYTTINAANVLIDGLEKLEGVIDDNLKLQYIAEARFIRGLSYFSLITLYGRPYIEDNGASKAIPLRLRPETTGANNDLARSTVAQVYDQILSDLNFAESELPEKYSNNELNTTRAHKNTAISLKTRIYLNMGNFDKVLEEVVKIVPQADPPFSAVNGVKNELNANILNIFNSDYTTTESVFSLPMSALDPPGNPLGSSYNVNSEFSLNADGILGDPRWGTDDARRGMLRQNTTTGQYFLIKYAKPFPYIDYVPVIRYAEVLLNYAEAAAHSDRAEIAVKLLKSVRFRSDPGYVFPEADISSGESLLNAIRIERRIELLGEGFRSNDLLRNLLPIPAKNSSSYQARQVNPTDDAYIFPLPNSEIIANKLLLN